MLPSGFMKVRRYGFANPNCSVSLETVKALIELSLGFEEGDFDPEVPGWEGAPRCPSCGGKTEVSAFRPALHDGTGKGRRLAASEPFGKTKLEKAAPKARWTTAPFIPEQRRRKRVFGSLFGDRADNAQRFSGNFQRTSNRRTPVWRYASTPRNPAGDLSPYMKIRANSTGFLNNGLNLTCP